jgi:hypothetical protein
VRLGKTQGKDNKFAVRFRMVHDKVTALPLRFALTHDNVFLKIEFSHLISIVPPQVYYNALYISII